MRGRVRVALAMTLALSFTTALVGSRDSLAITRRQADAVALATVPKRTPARAILFGLTRPIARGRDVAESGAQDGRVVVRIRSTRLRQRTWLFWFDEDYGAKFEHPSRLVLVDDLSGRVSVSKRLLWYPVVDGKPPAFLHSLRAYHARRFQVWRSPFLRRVQTHGGVRPAQRPNGDFTVGGNNGPFAITPQDLASDCLIMVGSEADGPVAGDFAAMEQFAKDVHLPAVNVKPSTLEGLRAAADQFFNNGCRDAVLYLSGHGYPTGHGPPAVNTRTRIAHDVRTGTTTDRRDKITASDLKALIRRYPQVKFKVKIDACFAGRFRFSFAGQQRPENLAVLELSSSEKEESYFALDDEPTSDNPTQASEFTNGNVHGLYAWARSQAEVSASGGDLAKGLERAFKLGRDWDAGRQAGLTHPPLPR